MIKTIRQHMKDIILNHPHTAQDISKLIGIREKEVYDHLQHISKTVSQKEKFIIHPGKCQSCHFEFKKRTRLTTPGRCPICKHESITRPLFEIVGK
jgi:predicted Zn-ribbon and HTH transcriptional regulator